MKNWVREKLMLVEELFPESEIERVWKGDEPLDRYPFVFSPITFTYYNEVHTPEERLRISLDEFIWRGRIHEDFIPTFFPGCRQGTIPSMFGAKEIVAGTDHSCERIIFYLEDIDKLPEPSIGPGTIAYEWLAMGKYLLEETEGRIPVHVADMQGSLDVCGQLWGYDNIRMAPYEEPEGN